MSAIVLQQRLTHYEVIGRGQPVLFLHSWLGSWRAWMPIMEMISDRYRAIALDFWGFGDSAAVSRTSIATYVEQIVGFVEALGMLPPHLIGHGLGGIVAIQAAQQHPDRFGKVLVAGLPVLGSSFVSAVRPSGLSRLLGRGSNDMWVRLVRQASNGDAAFAEIVEDIEATDPAIMQVLTDEIGTIDLRPSITRLPQPLLAIYGGRDALLAAEHGQHIADSTDAFRQVLMFGKSGHFPFLDQPEQFTRVLLEFLGGSEHMIELKEMWKRRVSAREFL